MSYDHLLRFCVSVTDLLLTRLFRGLERIIIGH